MALLLTSFLYRC